MGGSPGEAMANHGTRKHGRHEPEEARQRIGAVAAELFAERGYGGASMQTIADAAGVNKAMLYYYYASKRDLYSSIIESGLQALSGVLDGIGAGAGTAREKVAQFAERSYSLFDSQRAVVRILYRELMGLGENIALPAREHVLGDLAKLEAVIEAGIRQGEFRPVDPGLAARSLLGMLHIFIRESVLAGEAYPPQRVVDHTVELFCRGVAR